MMAVSCRLCITRTDQSGSNNARALLYKQCPVVGTIEQPCMQFNSVYDAVVGGPYSYAHSGALS